MCVAGASAAAVITWPYWFFRWVLAMEMGKQKISFLLLHPEWRISCHPALFVLPSSKLFFSFNSLVFSSFVCHFSKTNISICFTFYYFSLYTYIYLSICIKTAGVMCLLIYVALDCLLCGCFTPFYFPNMREMLLRHRRCESFAQNSLRRRIWRGREIA